jgi:RNA polymerase sigma factor (sigma-70 family)
MTPSQYIQANYSDIKKWLRNITNGERPDLFDDFIHDVIIIFMDNKNSQQAIDTGTARYFLVRIGLNQWRSSTSTFHYQYRHRITEELNDNHNTPSDEYDATDDYKIELILSSLDDMYETNRYEALIIILYYSFGANYSAVGRHLNMPHTTIRKIYLRGIKTLNKIIINKINGTNSDNRSNANVLHSGDIHSSIIKQSSLSTTSQIFKTRYFEKSVK